MKRIVLTAFLALVGSVCALGQDTAARLAGIDLYRAEDYQKAVEKLGPVVLGGQADLITAMYLAGSYVHLKRFKDAVALFKKIHAGKFGKFVDRVDSDQPVKITTRARPEFDLRDREFGGGVHVYLAVEFRAEASFFRTRLRHL